MREIDTRGLSCPQPVLMYHEAMRAEKSELDVLVDNEASLENVSRAARKNGWEVTAKPEAGGVTRLELRTKA